MHTGGIASTAIFINKKADSHIADERKNKKT